MTRRVGENDALDDEDALISLDELEESSEYEEPSLEDLFPSILDPIPDEDDEEEEED